MAYYADLFVRQFQGEAQGADYDNDEENFTAEQNALQEEIALQWLEQAAQSAEDPRTRNPARHELDQIRGPRPGEEQQGFREFGRRAVNALCHVPGIAHAGFRAATAVNKTLGQVTRYLTEDDIRGEVQRRIAQRIAPDTRVIIGNSLGSVAAYEAVHQLEQPLDLLVTLGSPARFAGKARRRGGVEVELIAGNNWRMEARTNASSARGHLDRHKRNRRTTPATFFGDCNDCVLRL